MWDPLVRICHWTLVIIVALAWLTREGWSAWHEWLGYGSIVILAVRIPWGFFGPVEAPFVNFVRRPGATLSYARRVLAGSEERHLGHNPLGAWMIVVLLTNLLLLGFSGWLYTTDRFWGVEWVEHLHGALADALLVLTGLHIAGVVFASWRQRESLIAAMVHGRKRPLD